MARPTKHHKPSEYKFKIDAYSKDTIPMRHLAKYLDDLAVLFGEDHNVHFDRLEDGCVMPIVRVDSEAVPKVRKRLHTVKLKEAPADVMKASRRINNRLRDDNSSGYIVAPDEKKIIIFPGADQQVKPVFGPFTQHGVLEGVPIVVGGEQEWVPIHLESRKKEIFFCTAKRSTAKEIAAYLFSAPIRVEGKARWLRNEDGDWELISFRVADFDVLRDGTLTEDIERLRQIPGKWKDLEDPLSEMSSIRHDIDAEFLDIQQ